VYKLRTMHYTEIAFRLRLVVDIGRLGIELGPIPNQTGFENESQY